MLLDDESMISLKSRVRHLVALTFASCGQALPASTPEPPMNYATLNEWIAREAIPCPAQSVGALEPVIDKIIASLPASVELLGFGEALHGGEEILMLRNRLFQCLAGNHGFSAIVIESSFPRALLVNDFINHRGNASSYDDVKTRGFGHGFGDLDANRELVEWMRGYNAGSAHATKLQFYGFDLPTGELGIASPRAVLTFAIDYLATIDKASAWRHRQRAEALLGSDEQWENAASMMDPTKCIGLSENASSLRITTEDLITELRTRGPELAARSDDAAYGEALQHALIARHLLNFHAKLASRKPGGPPDDVLGVRDSLMADNLTYILAREQGRGRVLVFAHNAHLQRTKASWPGQKYWQTDDPCEWWPAGSHLHQQLRERYAVIGTAVGTSNDNGIGDAEQGSLEARLVALGFPTAFIPTHLGRGLPSAEIKAVTPRTGSVRNLTYVPLTSHSFADFDWLALVRSTTYQRGGAPLQQWDPPKK